MSAFVEASLGSGTIGRKTGDLPRPPHGNLNITTGKIYAMLSVADRFM